MVLFGTKGNKKQIIGAHVNVVSVYWKSETPQKFRRYKTIKPTLIA